jgi:hypothetical protein
MHVCILHYHAHAKIILLNNIFLYNAIKLIKKKASVYYLDVIKMLEIKVEGVAAVVVAAAPIGEEAGRRERERENVPNCQGTGRW